MAAQQRKQQQQQRRHSCPGGPKKPLFKKPGGAVAFPGKGAVRSRWRKAVLLRGTVAKRPASGAGPGEDGAGATPNGGCATGLGFAAAVPASRTAALAQELGCEKALARAALAITACDAQKAKRLLLDGPQEAYAAGTGECGEGHGDAIFQHPYVQCLLEVARGRVREALRQQPGPESDRWLVCVRTYGRARPRRERHELGIQDLAVSSGVCRQEARRLEEQLLQAGVPDVPALEESLKAPSDLIRKFRNAGKKIYPNTLRKMSAWVARSQAPRLKQAERGLLDLSLAALTRALGPDASSRCLIFVSHEDKDVVSGQYDKALQGTPWADKMVRGVKGAHLQVRFIEEACPLGTHIVIADDNIEDFCVEVASEELMKKQKRQGIWSRLRRNLDLDTHEDPLHGTGLEAVEESEIQRFLRGARPNRPNLPVSELDVLEDRLKAVQIGTLPEFVKVLQVTGSLNERLSDAGLKKMYTPMLKTLEARVSQPLPVARVLARKTAGTVDTAKPSNLPELALLISRAGKKMRTHGANLWGVNPSQNPYFMHKEGEVLRRNAQQTGVFAEASIKLGLVYGAFFGIRALHDSRRYTRFGQVKDDVERTLRYWHHDGVFLRFKRYAVTKSHKPGMYAAGKGGISAETSAAVHEMEATRALQGIVKDFAWRYVRLPDPGESSNMVCGLIWHPAHKAQCKASAEHAREDKKGRKRLCSSAVGKARWGQKHSGK
mmetsp:Transcript_47513/g.137237  ORF Transcript_47513/g.137237 Transcript_47513/m.137237 type:complete len:721 (+) Transcript_47513:51-2213(+)